jgi:methionyl-tRNA synthetase
MSTPPAQPQSSPAPAPAAAAAHSPTAPLPGAGEPKAQITFEEFAKVDLRVAKVLSAEPHPSADRLWKLKVDDGSGAPRQLCAGVREHYTAEQLVGQNIIIVANLAPRVIRGEESRGMLLAASDAAKDAANRRVVLLTTRSDIPPGSIVS